MDKIVFVISISCVCLAAFVVCLDRIYIKRMLCRMEQMIDAAMEGTFTETMFDESVMSRLEGKLARYLWAGEVAMENLSIEKDNIKTMISDISHQTKTPISNLLLYTELLQELDLPKEGEQYVKYFHDQTEKLKFLISSLVKLSRLENGILTLHPREKNLKDLLEKLELEYAPKAVEKGLRFHVEKGEAWAVFDEKWTMEAVGNILDNAIKYTNSGGVEVRVKMFEMFACIQVQDTGIGIYEEEQAAIFGRFYRSRQVYHENGVGIGLFLARKIISSEGGYIKVDSKPKAGSVFSVYLPAEEANLSKV